MTNKKIRSKIAITYHPTVKTTASSILTGKILGVARPRFDYIAVKYEYRDAADVVIEAGAWTMEGEATIDALMAQIAPLLPPPAGEVQDEIEKYYTGFLFVAADSWSNNVGDWEIIDDIV